MPSILHEAFVALFRNRPTLAAELLRDVLHARIPAYREIRFESAQLSEAHLAGFRARLRCPVWLPVVCPDPSVARWCAEPIEMGHPGWVLCPPCSGQRRCPK